MIIKRDFIYTPKGKNRPLHIYLPEGYETSDARYPVMYFFDGHNLFSNEDATYGKSWGLRDFLYGWEKDIIVVGIECGHEGRERLSEYSPYDLPDFLGGNVEGTGKATMDWIVNELKPFIDAEYRTFSFREATAIGGSSMGGLMALYAAIRYNDVFSKAACVSGTISPCFANLVTDIVSTKLDPDTRVYLSWGTEEAGGAKRSPYDDWHTQTARNNLAIEGLLQQQNLCTWIACQRFGHHCEADWEKQVPELMDFLWQQDDPEEFSV